MRLIKIVKVVTVAGLAVIAAVAALWLWYGPQSPVGRCSKFDWPPDAVRFGGHIEDRRYHDGARRLHLTLWDTSAYPQYVLIKKLPVHFGGLNEGSVVALTPLPQRFVSDPIPRNSESDIGAQVQTQPLPGWIRDRARLPGYISGVFPVRGRSSVLQTQGRNPERGTHWPHTGTEHAVDIAAPIGTSVLAMRPGTVVYLRDGWPDFPCGKSGSTRWRTDNALWIKDDSGVTIIYGHLQRGSVMVKEGDRVVAGQRIGAVGRSGAGFTSAHLHLEAGGGIADPKTNYWVTVPLRFQVCGERGPLRGLVYKEKIFCPVP